MRLPSFDRSAAILVILLSAALGACVTHRPAPVEQIGGGPRFLDDGKQHLVNGGETLYAVAWMYDLDVNALARANNLASPYTVRPGMTLIVDPRVVGGALVSGAVVGSVASTTGGSVVPSAPVGTAVATAVVNGGGLQRTPLPTTTLPSNNLPSNNLPNNNEPSAGSLPPLSNDAPVATPSTPEASTTARVTLPSEAVATLPATSPLPPPPVATPAGGFTGSGNITWDWPYRGAIVARFTDAAVEGKGVDLAGKAGDAVLAAADGEVVYAGGGLQRYGNLLILKHNDHFLSAYAHNRTLLVKEGAVVRRGQKIAELGNSGVDRDMLHFEIRQDGKPVDPLLYLPAP
ncbi:MAG: peptidoglycan DD-metalloendopeptidase family protein [Pseudomonadales bacterium]|nr:peptidoglycan DD-metalloendopeptidase family protein [Pseudomonadales bacterium]